MALKLWQLAVLAGAVVGALFSTMSLALGAVFAVFLPAAILVAVRDVERSRSRS